MKNYIDLGDKVAMVTGAGAGIGHATSLRLSHAGATVVCADVNAERGRAVSDFINSEGGRGAFVECDVSKSQSVAHTINEIMSQFGRLDVAFNNAGILGPMGKTVVDIEEEEWAQTLAINLTSVWLCLKHQIPAMLKSGGGSIVNNASVAGLIAAPRNPAYGAAKHGVVGLTKSVAMQYAEQNIRVNAVCPGIIETGFSDASVRTGELPKFPAPYIPMGREGKPVEIGNLVVWLLSDQASYLTGEAVGADGGWRSM